MSFKAWLKIHIQILFRDYDLDSEAAEWIKRLRLRKHPEGGYFRETFRSDGKVAVQGYKGKRNLATAIYYMLTGKEFSAFHRVKSDELWHHYAGGSLTLYVIKNEKMSRFTLGKAARQAPQVTIEGGCWTAASIKSGSYCLVGCTVSPGFDFRDWELGTKARLAAAYPKHEKIIKRYAIV
jgi:predicted cupin superfamily sugar epimerase